VTVLLTSVSRARPGRRADVVGVSSEAKKLLERLGVGECRLSMAATAGEASGTFAFTMQFDSNEAYGTFADRAAEDQDLQGLTERLDRDDSPIVTETQSLAAEIPLDRAVKDGRGSVAQAYISRAHPGRFEAALDLGRRAFDFVEANGALNARLYTLLGAGSMTDALLATWEFENMRALGRAGDAYLSDPNGLALMQFMTSSDCPVTTISSGVYTNIPI
jgi:hypothetical protein